MSSPRFKPVIPSQFFANEPAQQSQQQRMMGSNFKSSKKQGRAPDPHSHMRPQPRIKNERVKQEGFGKTLSQIFSAFTGQDGEEE
jgi:hypothetical protein